MIIQSKRVWIHQCLQPAQITISDGKVIDISDYGSKKVDIEYGDLMILPGFIDIHTHGVCGIDACYADKRNLPIIQHELTNEGVTAFVAALATQSVKDTTESIKRLSNLVGTGSGAELLGIFLEGNFINETYRGSQDLRWIEKPNIASLKQFIEAGKGHLIRMILAIEKDDQYQTLQYAVSNGIEVSIGHSSATAQQVIEAVKYGATSITHTFNGMKGLHHRETGIVGAALLTNELYTEIIADGYHTDWKAIELLGKNKDSEHLILISDASSLKGYQGKLPEGIYCDGQQQFRTVEGALAGSSLRINEGIYHLINKANVPLVSAINAATSNPATLLHLNHRKGTIAIGYDADLVVATSKFEVKQTFCSGIAMICEELL